MLNEKILDCIINDIKLMDDSFDFFDVINKNITWTKTDSIYYFLLLWKVIPDKYLYDTYKDNLSSVECGRLYNDFFDKELISKIMTCNYNDTIGNPTLQSIADINGNITIYHGHCKPTLRNSNSWTTSYDIAKWFGKRNSLFYQNNNYYVVSGKVPLKNIIAYITDRNEYEVVVQPKYVNNRKKEFFINIK